MSDETEVEMFMFRRWSMIALEFPSRSDDTENAANCKTSPFFAPPVTGAAEALIKLTSRTAGCPAVTVKDSFKVI